MGFRHQAGAPQSSRPRPASEPPPMQAILEGGTPTTPANDIKERRWFRNIFKRKNQLPKVWDTMPTASARDVLPPPPPTPPSQPQPGGSHASISSQCGCSADKLIVVSGSYSSDCDVSPTCALSGEDKSGTDVVLGVKAESPRKQECNSACGAFCQEREGETTTNGEDATENRETGPELHEPKLPMGGLSCDQGESVTSTAALSPDKQIRQQEDQALQPVSQILTRRSTRDDPPVTDVVTTPMLPPPLSIETVDDMWMDIEETTAPSTKVEEVTSERSNSCRYPRTARANADKGAHGVRLPAYKSLTTGMPVLSLGISSPRNDGAETRRWRPAEVINVIIGESGPTEVTIRFWSVDHQVVDLRLKEDWNRLTVPLSLTPEEIDSGAPLTGDALATSKKMFKPRSRSGGRSSKGDDERRRRRGRSRSSSRHRSSSISATAGGEDGDGFSSSTAVRRSRIAGDGKEVIVGDKEGRAAVRIEPISRNEKTLGSNVAPSPENPSTAGIQVSNGTGSSRRSRSGSRSGSRTRGKGGSRSDSLTFVDSKGLPQRSPVGSSTSPTVVKDQAGGVTADAGRVTQERHAASSPLRSRGLTRDSKASIDGGGSERGSSRGTIKRTTSDVSGRSGGSSRRRWNFGEERHSSGSRGPQPGDRFDCLDYFVSNQSGCQVSKWREAEVVEIRHTGDEMEVLVHFPTWASRWDRWISLTRERERFAPHLSRAVPAQERSNAERVVLDQGPLPAYQHRTRAGSNSTASTATPTVASGSSSIANGGASRGYSSDGLGELSRGRRGSSRSHHSDRITHSERVPHPRRGGGSGGNTRGPGVRRPRSPGGSVIMTVGGDVLSTASSTVTSGGCSSSPASSEIDSVGSSDSQFREAMRRKGLSIIDVEPDGNCLFRSVSHQIYGDADRHNQVRKACVEHMSKHRARFGVFVTEDFRDYLHRIKQLGVWGDDLEIRALEELFDRPIEIYSSEAEDLRPMKIDFDASGLDLESTPIKLSYHGQSHYNSVRDKSFKYPLHPRRSKNILHIRQAQHARTPRSANISRAGGGRAGEGPSAEALSRRTPRRLGFRRLRDRSPFPRGTAKKTGSALRTIFGGVTSRFA